MPVLATMCMENIIPIVYELKKKKGNIKDLSLTVRAGGLAKGAYATRLSSSHTSEGDRSTTDMTCMHACRTSPRLFIPSTMTPKARQKHRFHLCEGPWAAKPQRKAFNMTFLHPFLDWI